MGKVTADISKGSLDESAVRMRRTEGRRGENGNSPQNGKARSAEKGKEESGKRR